MQDNNLNIIISGSRFSKEKDTIIDVLRREGYSNITIYDCEDETTDMDVVTKQQHINKLIAEYDWYVLMATTNTYGEYTMIEWEALINSLKENKESNNHKLVTVVRCENVEESVDAQNIPENGKHHFNEFLEIQKKAGIGNNFFLTYRYDKDFSDLRVKFSSEIQRAMSQNLLLRRISIPRKKLKASDVFTNKFRTEEINGYNEDIYIWRESVDAELELSPLFTVITGAPASGKTRAAYQFMKYSDVIGDNARIINVTRNNLNIIGAALIDFQKWITKNKYKAGDYDEYILFFDEIIDTLLTHDDIKEFQKIVSVAQNMNMRIIATALNEDLDHLLSRDIIASHDKVINIPFISEDNPEVRKAVKEKFPNTSVVDSENASITDVDTLLKDSDDRISDVESLLRDDDTDESANTYRYGVISEDSSSKPEIRGSNNGDVIGEYIQGLKDYHLSIKNNIRGWLRKRNGESDKKKEEFLRLFVEAFTVIKTYRRESNQMPLGLILMIIDKSKENILNETDLEELLSFFNTNNILEIYDRSSYESVTSVWLNRKAIYSYDSEDYHMLVPESYILRPLNDYIWTYLVDTYGLTEFTNVEVEKKAMELFFRAFHDEAPLTTIRRIVTRSHSVVYANRYQAQKNHARDYVYPYVLSHASDKHLWDTQFDVINNLLANILHVSSRIEQLKDDYKKFKVLSEGRFILTDSSVAEIMGFASNRTENVKKQIIDFLTENGWNFDQTYDASIYYHQRQIEYCESMDSAMQYIKTHLLDTEEQIKENLRWWDFEDTPDEIGFRRFNVIRLQSALLKSCNRKNHLSGWVKFAGKIGLFNKMLLKTLTTQVNKIKMSREDNCELVVGIKDLLFDNNTYKMDFDNGIIAYYLLTMCNCLSNSIMMYDLLKDHFKHNADLRVRCESIMLSKMNEDEYGLFFKEFFDHGELKYNFSNPTRNHLLKQMIIEISLALVPQLFDGKTPDAVADQYTMDALLKGASNFMDKARFKEKVRKKDTAYMTFQYLKQIMNMPMFHQLIYDEPLICQMINCAISKEQEDYIFKHYIKPSIRRQIEKEDIHYASEEIMDQEIDKRLNELKNKPQIATNLIYQKYLTDINEVLDISLKGIAELKNSSKGQNVVDASLVTVTFNKIFHLYSEGYDPEVGDNPNLKLSKVESLKKKFLQGVLKVPFPKSTRSLWDQLIKDKYFYCTYFKLYPEEAVERVDGHYRLSKGIDEIPKDYIGFKLVSNILQGVAAIICKKEGNDTPLHEIEEEFANLIYDFSWDIYSYNLVRKFFPGYKFSYPIPLKENRRIKVDPNRDSDEENDAVNGKNSPQAPSISTESNHRWHHLEKASKILKGKSVPTDFDWDALLDITEDVVRHHPESMPYLNNLYDVVKSHKMPPLYLLEMIRIVYLKRGWGVGVTLWKAVLESIKGYKKYYKDKERQVIGDEIADLTEKFGHLIQENDITLVLQLNFLHGEAYKRAHRKVFSSDMYLTQMSLGLLIHSPKHFAKDMIKYLDTMYSYMYNAELLHGDNFEITKDFTRFTVEFCKMYSDWGNKRRIKELTCSDYEDISDILYQTLRAKPELRDNLKIHLKPIAESFKKLLKDIEANTDDDVTPLYALLTGE